MKNIAVVYSTKFGHTKTYADWLKEDVDADVISVDSFNATKMLAYKLIIFASGVYGDKLPIMDYIKKNLSSIPADKIMIMAVSWYTNDSEEAAKKLADENFPEQYKKIVPIYVLNSGLDKKKVPVTDKAKLIAAQMMIEKKDDRSSDDINALAIIKGYSDQTSRDNLASIKKGIEEFFAPKKKEAPTAEQKPTPAPAPKPAPAAPAPKPAPVAPAPEPEPVQTAAEDDLSSSVAAAFKNLGAPKPAPAAPAPEPEPVQAADEDDLSSSVAAAFKNLGAPKPAPAAPAPEPEPVQTAAEDDLSSSVAAAFKNLGAPKPAPAAPAPEPEPVQTADEDDLSSSVAAAFKNLGVSAPKNTSAPTPAPVQNDDESDVSNSVADALKHLGVSVPEPEPAPEPVAEAPKNDAVQTEKYEAGEPEPEEPVVRFNSKGQVVVSSVLDAINSLNNTSSQTAPKHDPADRAEQKPAAVNTENEQNVHGNPDTAERKNSYMELFASRRKKAAASAAENQAAPAPSESKAPVQETAKPGPKPELTPVRSTAPENDFTDFDLDISQTVSNSSEFTFSSPSSAESAPAASDIDLDGYDFIGEEQKPTVSKRVLNAVQDLAKAKAEAEKEAAKKAAELAAEKAAKETEEAAGESEEAVSEKAADADRSSAPSAAVTESAFEKMKRDMEALAHESENDAEYGEDAEYNEENDMYAVTTFQEEDEDDQDEIKEFVFEEPSEDGLDAFAFADTHDYYAGKTSTPEIAKAEQPKAESNTELDLKKLQEQINASIEANKINRERMQSRYGKRVKETVNNPFAVQFDDEENPKNKKNKKQAASEPKRLADPIDPDIFFSKPGKNKDFDMISDTMPEIKFKH